MERKERDMRLAAQAKMGYYPTPESVTQAIAGYLKRQRYGLIRILDPCAGEGTAVYAIGNQLEAETYGIEIDLKRGSKAKEILNKCIVSDYQNTRITHGSFSLLWLNPPYDWAARDDEIDGLYDQIYRELLSFMIENPKNITRATHLIWAAHNLERSADRVTNICERVIFVVTGKMQTGASKY